MTKQNPHKLVTPAQEGALAKALEAFRHTEQCHAAYQVLAAAKNALGALQSTCSRCLTHVKNGWHSPECSQGYKVFIAARKSLQEYQKDCPKCGAREKLKGVSFA
jgi:exosome complex RNA-binding protein Csl4